MEGHYQYNERIPSILRKIFSTVEGYTFNDALGNSISSARGGIPLPPMSFTHGDYGFPQEYSKSSTVATDMKVFLTVLISSTELSILHSTAMVYMAR